MENGKFKLIISLTAFACVMVLVFTSIISTKANPDSVIDLEGLPEGSIVSSVSYGSGISGDAVSGEVSVFGFNPAFGPDTNAAMIFDAACLPEGTPAGCTGGDSDLFWPEAGNVLIISEDMDSSDPDDADVVGAVFEFDYSNWGTGKVTVHSISVQDVEIEEAGAATLQLFSGGLDGTLLAETLIPETGDSQHQEIPINVSGVDAMRVDLDGSGAITNISITPDALTPTPTDTPTATPTETSTPTPTATDTPTDTPSSTPTDTPTATPTETSTPTSTDTPTATPTDTPSSTPTDTPTATPTDTPTATSTPVTPTSTPRIIIPPNPTSTSTSTPITPTPTSTPSEPTAIELLYFRVDEVVGQQVKLAWATSAEIDHYGFRLYRSPDSNFENAEPIHFQAGEGNVAGSTYSFTGTVPNSGRWWYWLADIDTAGRERIDPAFSPVFADVRE